MKTDVFWCLPLNEWINENQISISKAALHFGYSRSHMSVIYNQKKAYVINNELYVNRVSNNEN